MCLNCRDFYQLSLRPFLLWALITLHRFEPLCAFTTESLQILSFVPGRLGKGNATLGISKLHHRQNSAARLVMRCKPRDHITPSLQKLHWLPVELPVHRRCFFFLFDNRRALAVDKSPSVFIFFHARAQEKEKRGEKWRVCEQATYWNDTGYYYIKIINSCMHSGIF